MFLEPFESEAVPDEGRDDFAEAVVPLVGASVRQQSIGVRVGRARVIDERVKFLEVGVFDARFFVGSAQARGCPSWM